MENKLLIANIVMFLVLGITTCIQALFIKDNKKESYIKKINKRTLIISYILFLISICIVFPERYQNNCDYLANSDYEVLVVLRLVCSIIQMLVPIIILSFAFINKIQQKYIKNTEKKTRKYIILSIISFFLIGIINSVIGTIYSQNCDDYMTKKEGCYMCKIENK